LAWPYYFFSGLVLTLFMEKGPTAKEKIINFLMKENDKNYNTGTVDTKTIEKIII